MKMQHNKRKVDDIEDSGDMITAATAPSTYSAGDTVSTVNTNITDNIICTNNSGGDDKISCLIEVGDICEDTDADDGTILPAHDYRRRRGFQECMQDISRVEGKHYPIQYHRKEKGKDHRRKCRWCDNYKTSVYCMNCGVALCIKNMDGTTCWRDFHDAPLQVQSIDGAHI
mmetsp:Transcript_14961/g.22507  ORF Transcript_14961/g.22507 Transcript_14961/m.22507 type:complete len:171 (-) Transcript_14961:40-552(-)